MSPPTFRFERELHDYGFRIVAGVDEVGCGALAGPVVAAAVILPLTSRLGLVRDSKLLSETQRERLFGLIIERCGGYAVGSASVAEIEEIGIRPATYLAMRRSVEGLAQVDHLLVDAWTIPEIIIPQRGIIHGDRLVKSIAAASIIAKVTRDRQMRRYHEVYPCYGFNKHKGYGTQSHQAALIRFGACPIHRISFLNSSTIGTCSGSTS